MGPGRDPSLLLELPFESSQVQYQAVVRGVLELPGVQGNQDDRHGPLSLSHTRVLASPSPRGGRRGSTLQGGCRGWCRSSAGKRLQRRGLPSRQHCSQPPPQRGCFQGRLSNDRVLSEAIGVVHPKSKCQSRLKLPNSPVLVIKRTMVAFPNLT